ncbi:probable proline--tRNA ligase, mitochondrial isoform X2 [Lineus longissimus]|uniref:probable proline--tRNA ligase, mitochondrial isoform X2 n=1 Tax=Lineus longissimus TaxID=88925 RepID=UPI00315D96D2
MKNLAGLKIYNFYRISVKTNQFTPHKAIPPINLNAQDSFLINYGGRRSLRTKILGEKCVRHLSNRSANSGVFELLKVRNRFSKMYENVAFLETLPTESDISCSSQRLMLYNGIIAQAHSGTYHLLPMGLRALNKLKKVINDGMESIGAQELALPCLTPGDLWKTSGRWDTTGSELFKLKDRHNIDHCLGPTHEEVITSLVATHTNLSHRQLPIKLFQITRKFRDEMAPKYGLLRGREFEMKDLYTFDSNPADAKVTYEEVCGAYDGIFKRLGLKFVKVVGDTGNIGGQLSHEYHLTADVGEDNLVTCKRCDFGANEEMIDKDNLEKHKCHKPGCDTDFTFTKGIEVGHAFLLGTKYSKLFKAAFLNEKQKRYNRDGLLRSRSDSHPCRSRGSLIRREQDQMAKADGSLSDMYHTAKGGF